MQPTGLAMVSMFAPLAFVLVLSLGVNKLSNTAAQALYWAFCAAMGASLTNIFMIYTHGLDRAGVLHHRRDLRRRRASTATPRRPT